MGLKFKVFFMPIVCSVFLVSIAIMSSSCRPATTGSITGRVIDDITNSPLVNVTITVTDLNDKPVSSSLTDEKGGYRFNNIPDGEYRVTAKIDGYRIELYNGVDGRYKTPHENIQTIYITKSKTISGLDFRMHPLASISGHVYNGLKQPVADATIRVYGPHWMAPSSKNTKSSNDGSYLVTGLNKGESYLICTAKGYVTQYYSGVHSQSDSKQVTTSFGETTSNIDFYLEKGGTISGSVYESDGTTPVKQIKSGDNRTETWIYYFQVTGEKTPLGIGNNPSGPTYVAMVDNDSRYYIDGLLTGTYDLFSLTRSGKGIISSEHKRIEVNTGLDTKNIDMVNLPGGSLSGHIYLKDGKTPITDTGVTVSIDTGFVPKAGYRYDAGGTRTNTEGSFYLGLLPPGTVYIRVSDDKEYTVIIESGKNTILNIALDENP